MGHEKINCYSPEFIIHVIQFPIKRVYWSLCMQVVTDRIKLKYIAFFWEKYAMFFYRLGVFSVYKCIQHSFRHHKWQLKVKANLVWQVTFWSKSVKWTKEQFLVYSFLWLRQGGNVFSRKEKISRTQKRWNNLRLVE